MTRTLTPQDAASLVRTRDTVGFGLGPAIPDAFMTALGGRDDWEDLILGGALLLGLYDVLARPGVSYRCGFYGPVERYYLSQGARIDHVPGGFRQFGPILARFSPRVMVVQTAPPDRHGQLNLSLHYGATRDELLRAGRDPGRLLVVEVNPNLPRTGCLERYPNTLPLDAVDVLVEADGQPFALDEAEPSEVDRAIAAHALAFVSDGVTLQTGIGGVPSMVATLLAQADGGGYGVHSEMFTDGLMRLHLAGKVTNTAKGEFQGVSVTTFALGSADLYHWLDGNPEVAFLPVEVVNDPTVIGGNAKLISINGALSVDLYGQIVADSVGGRQVSGVGGPRGLRRRGRAAPRLAFAGLPALDRHRRRRAGLAHRAPPRRGVGGLHPPPPHRGGGDRARLGGPGGAHRHRASTGTGRDRPPAVP